MSRLSNIPASQVLEEIQSLHEFPDQKRIDVTIGLIDADGVWIVPQMFKLYEIRDAMYDELNQANPSWNATKPAGTYFNEDLWHFIDILRSTNA
jgi:hypothetical protein